MCTALRATFFYYRWCAFFSWYSFFFIAVVRALGSYDYCYWYAFSLVHASFEDNRSAMEAKWNGKHLLEDTWYVWSITSLDSLSLFFQFHMTKSRTIECEMDCDCNLAFSVLWPFCVCFECAFVFCFQFIDLSVCMWFVCNIQNAIRTQKASAVQIQTHHHRIHAHTACAKAIKIDVDTLTCISFWVGVRSILFISR